MNDKQEYLCNLFSKFLEIDNEVRNSAESEVNQLIQTDFVDFLTNCSSIIMRDDINYKFVFFAIQSIARALSPYGASMGEIRNIWMQIQPEIRNYIKTATFRGLMFNENRITNITSKAICILALLEGNEFFPVIEKVVDSAIGNCDQSFYSDSFSLPSFYVLKEILSSPYYYDHINDILGIKEFIQVMNGRVLDFFANSCREKSGEYKESVASVVNSLILCASPLYKNEAGNSLIPIVASYFTPDSTNSLYNTLCQILYNLIQINYSENRFDFPRCFKLISDQMSNIQNPQKLSSLINFWYHLSKYEINLLQKIIKYYRLLESQIKIRNGFFSDDKERISQVTFPKPVINRNFSKLGAINLTEKLLSVLTMINPSEMSSESKDAPLEPHMYSTCCLVNFYVLNQRIVLDSISKFWKKVYSTYHKDGMEGNYNLLIDGNIPWTLKHALLLTVSVICTDCGGYKYYDKNFYSNEIDKSLLENVDYDPNVKKDALAFLTEEVISPQFRIFYDFVLQAVAAPIPRVVDTALYTILLCVEQFEIGLEVNENAPFVFLMSVFRDLISASKYDENIFKRILYLLSEYFKKFGKNDFTLIDHFKDQIFALIGFGLSAPNNSYDVYILTNKMLEDLIIYTPNREILERIFRLTMSTLTELMKINTNEMTIVKQQQSLNIITFVLNRKGFVISEEDLMITSKLIFHLMEQKTIVFEDALRCLRSIINKSEKNLYQIADTLLQFIPVALSSNSPSIITMTTFTLAHLYKSVNYICKDSLPSSLVEALPKSINLIISCFKESKFTKDFYPTLLIALANLVSSSRKYIPFKIVEDIKNIYFEYVSKPINNSNKYAVEFENNLYKAIFMGFAAIFDVFHCLDPQMQLKLKDPKVSREFILKPVRNFLLINSGSFNFVNESSLFSYCNFLIAFKEFFTKSNAQLCKIDNFKPLFYAFISDNDDLRRLASISFEEIKQAYCPKK